MKFFIFFIALFLASCDERIIVQFPECEEGESVTRICDNEVHYNKGEAVSSWDNHLVYGKIVSLDNQFVDIPDNKGHRICRKFDACTWKSLSKDFPVPIGENGFFIADSDFATIKAVIIKAYQQTVLLLANYVPT